MEKWNKRLSRWDQVDYEVERGGEFEDTSRSHKMIFQKEGEETAIYRTTSDACLLGTVLNSNTLLFSIKEVMNSSHPNLFAGMDEFLDFFYYNFDLFEVSFDGTKVAVTFMNNHILDYDPMDYRGTAKGW